MCKTLDDIKRYGISIRQIPRTRTSMYSMDRHKDGRDISSVVVAGPNISLDRVKKFKNSIEGRSKSFYLDEDTMSIMRMYSVKTEDVKNGGCWMSQINNDTSSNITWNIKIHNLAPTLEQSVSMCIEKLKNKIRVK